VLPDLCHLFPSISPWNVYDLKVRHYLAFVAVVVARRNAARE
jgi:hypothetical protein